MSRIVKNGVSPHNPKLAEAGYPNRRSSVFAVPFVPMTARAHWLGLVLGHRIVNPVSIAFTSRDGSTIECEHLEKSDFLESIPREMVLGIAATRWGTAGLHMRPGSWFLISKGVLRIHAAISQRPVVGSLGGVR